MSAFISGLPENGFDVAFEDRPTLTVTPMSTRLTPAQRENVALKIGGGAVLFPDVYPSGDLVVRARRYGVETFQVLKEAAAPESIAFTIGDSSNTIQLSEYSDSAVIDSTGVTLTYIDLPWARDASGATVTVTASALGNVLTLNVAHRGLGYKYPIIVDPYIKDWAARGDHNYTAPNGTKIKMRAWGFISDRCLGVAQLVCKTSTGNYRSEATAQAQVLRHLSWIKDYWNTNTNTKVVQWEVSPFTGDNPDSGDPDTADTVNDACGSTRWRIDVVYGKEIYEVKRYQNHGNHAGVKDQLECYKGKSQSTALDFEEGRTLNDAGWAYEWKHDDTFWYVWAPTGQGEWGHIYFGTQAETPDNIEQLAHVNWYEEEHTKWEYQKAKWAMTLPGFWIPVPTPNNFRVPVGAF